MFYADIPTGNTRCRGDSQQVDGHALFCRCKPSLPPATLVLAQCAEIQNGLGNGARGSRWTQQHGLPLGKTEVASTSIECPAGTEFPIWHRSP